MTTLVTRLADRLLSALAPEVQAEAVLCLPNGNSFCERCAAQKARRWDSWTCSDGTTRATDNGCGSC